MDSATIQDNFIQKRLLYKSDKKIDVMLQQYFRLISSPQEQTEMIDQNQNCLDKVMSKQQLLQQIDQLMFQNFKYRTTILSAKKDQEFNDQILNKQQIQISNTKQQIKLLSNQLNNALITKKHKQQYNILAETIKKYQGKAIQDKKILQIQDEITNMEQAYSKQMHEYQKKQKCLKMALAALKGVIDWESKSEIEVESIQKQKEVASQIKTPLSRNQRQQGESDAFY